MNIIEKFGRESNVWLPHNEWDGETITTLWSSIWDKLDPYLRTETQRQRGTNSITCDKSRKGQISWRTCYNKMAKKKLFEGNRIRRSATVE